MIKNFEPRLYQETILATASLNNTLVVLPTGMGKTNIFLMLAAKRLRQYPDSRILLLGPTRPLIDQYYRVFTESFDIPEEKMAVFTGMVPPEKREELWKRARIVFSTPQGMENDVLSNRIDLSNVSLLGFDEAHRAVGNYSYVWIAKRYSSRARFPRIIGMTASPGSTLEKIEEVCKNLSIEEIEVRTEEDPDVKPYIQELNIEWATVTLPESFMKVHKYLTSCLSSKIAALAKLGVSTGRLKMTRTEMLGLQRQVQARLSMGERDFTLMRASSLLAEAMKVEHALGLIESQGILPLHRYLAKLEEQSRTTSVKAVKNLVRDLNFRSARILTAQLVEAEIEHPKLALLRNVIQAEFSKGTERRIMVFTQYRDTATTIVKELNALDGIDARLFVGQMKKGATGLSQKKQREMLEEFAAETFNVLVATSIGEEGLDIPSVDLVVFYEPVPSAIRSIQRRGRTARLKRGRVVVLIADGTRDVAMRWIAHRKEKLMHSILDKLKRSIGSGTRSALTTQMKTAHISSPQATLSSFTGQPGEGLKIVADYREKESGTVRALADAGVELELTTLPSADFVLSRRVGIELKTVPDFVDSLIDGRLLSQLKELRHSYELPLVMVEGTEDIYAMRKVHPNAIRGMLATIAVSYHIPLIFSRAPEETTSYLLLIARREQELTGKAFSPHGSKKPLSTRESQEYIVGALPGVGPSLAKGLLAALGSVERVFTAGEDELKKIENIGEKKAREIRRVVSASYESRRNDILPK